MDLTPTALRHLLAHVGQEILGASRRELLYRALRIIQMHVVHRLFREDELRIRQRDLREVLRLRSYEI